MKIGDKVATTRSSLNRIAYALYQLIPKQICNRSSGQTAKTTNEVLEWLRFSNCGFKQDQPWSDRFGHFELQNFIHTTKAIVIIHHLKAGLKGNSNKFSMFCNPDHEGTKSNLVEL